MSPVIAVDDLAHLFADPAGVELVVDALRTTAVRYQRAATRAAGELATDRGLGLVTDDRPASVRIARALADADRLARFADALAAAQKAVAASPAATSPTATTPPTAPAAPQEPPLDVASRKAGRRTVASARAEAVKAALEALGSEPEDLGDDDELAEAFEDLTAALDDDDGGPDHQEPPDAD